MERKSNWLFSRAPAQHIDCRSGSRTGGAKLRDYTCDRLALGLARWWSGSTLLTIMMPVGWNFTYNFIPLLLALRNG